MAPLNVLLRKTHPWEWTPIQHSAFENMKVAFASQPVLLMPDYNKPFEIESDTSLYATGAVLLQQDTNGEWHPVAFHPQCMSPTERNYQVYDREIMAIIHALCDWQCYIYGSPFTTIVWTDHHNLTYYTHPQKLTRRQVRWVVELMEYDLKLQHKKGSKMVVADALSWRADWSTGLEHDNKDVVALPESLWVRLVDTELQDAVAVGQQEDNLVRDAVAKLSDPSVSPQRWTIETSGPDSSTRLLFYNGCLYIPDSLNLWRRIVSDHHDTPVAGHPGSLATTRSVRTSYWWPGMAAFITKYVQGCATCQQFKVQTHPQQPVLVPIDSTTSRLFGQVGINFMTDLPPLEGSDSIMVVVDHGLSKGVILTPCSKTGLTASQTAQLYINNVYGRFGLPDKMISNCGPQFDSQFWKELCDALQIKHAMTTAFQPQTNRGTDRMSKPWNPNISIHILH